MTWCDNCEIRGVFWVVIRRYDAFRWYLNLLYGLDKYEIREIYHLEMVLSFFSDWYITFIHNSK